MKRPPSPGTDESSPNVRDLKLILEHLENRRNVVLSGYKKDFLKKQIQRRMSLNGCTSPGKYLEILRKDPEETDILAESLMVGYSLFFRDPLTYEYLGAEILTELAMTKRARGDNLMRIWSCGCYTGEEPYSMALLVQELREKGFLNFEIAIFGTDINDQALEKARTGCYPRGALENTRFGMVNRFFLQRDDMFCLTPEVREMVSFSTYNMISSRHNGPSEGVFNRYDIILCRNVLLYLEQEDRKNIFEKLYRNLGAGGYLVLGKAETLPASFAGRMEETQKSCRIYYKVY